MCPLKGRSRFKIPVDIPILLSALFSPTVSSIRACTSTTQHMNIITPWISSMSTSQCSSSKYQRREYHHSPIIKASFIHTSRHNKSLSLLSTKPNRSTIRYLTSSHVENDGRSDNYESDEVIISKTKFWIKEVVIGLNFCPFAEKSWSKSHIFTSVVRGNDIEDIVSNILYESIIRKDEPGTTVVICPDVSPNNFHEYLDTLQIVEDVLEDNDLVGDIQIAPFHPLFEFEGSGDGIDNLTNRSPYPIFHILREDEVEIAVDKIGGDASKVWKRNIKLLENFEDAFGRDNTERIMKGEKMDGIDISKIMKKTKMDMDDDKKLES